MKFSRFCFQIKFPLFFQMKISGWIFLWNFPFLFSDEIFPFLFSDELFPLQFTNLIFQFFFQMKFFFFVSNEIFICKIFNCKIAIVVPVKHRNEKKWIIRRSGGFPKWEKKLWAKIHYAEWKISDGTLSETSLIKTFLVQWPNRLRVYDMVASALFWGKK